MLLPNYWKTVELLSSTGRAESREEMDRLRSAVSCLATKKERIARGGYVLLKNLWCVVKKQSPCLHVPQKSLGSG